VLHSWWGLNPFFKRLCGRFAARGFVALAPDLYGGRVATTNATARALRAASTSRRKEPVYRFLMRQIETLVAHEAVDAARIGVVGFSMGGHWALWLSQRRDLPIGATVTFYAARSGDFSQSRSAFLCHFAEDDPEWVSHAAQLKLQKCFVRDGAAATCHVYPRTAHWFFERDRVKEFDPRAARLAWSRTIAFLDQNL